MSSQEPEATETIQPAAPPLGTVKEILDAAGGPAKIAEASQGSVTIDAVYKWPKIGIPDRHWPIVMGLCPVTADQLLKANIAARNVDPA